MSDPESIRNFKWERVSKTCKRQEIAATDSVAPCLSVAESSFPVMRPIDLDHYGNCMAAYNQKPCHQI